MKHLLPISLSLFAFIIYGSLASARELVITNTDKTGPAWIVAVSTPQTGLEQWGEIRSVSAYSELDSCHTGKTCLMASGKKAYVGAVACPRSIKLGTKVIIQGETYTCEDRLAVKYDSRIDKFMGYGVEAHTEALKWGVRKLEVTLVR